MTVVNSYTTHIPGHAHLEALGHAVEQELKDLGYNVWYCNIGGAVDDGIAMGHFGMKYSLPSRELITDQIETVIGAHPCDGWIGIGNCDKIVPAMYNAMVRLNIPAVYVSGGPMLAGQGGTDLITVFEGVGKHSVGKMSEAGPCAARGAGLPGLRFLLRHVHRQLDELSGRSGRAGAARQRHDPRGEMGGNGRTVPNPDREALIRQVGAGAQALHRSRNPAAGHRHPGRHRQRLYPRHGDGRLDQYCSAHARPGA